MLMSGALCAIRKGLPIKLHIKQIFTTAIAFTSRKTVDSREVDKFDKSAEAWWDDTHGLLHAMNSLRVPLVRDGILSTASQKFNEKSPRPLVGFSILDVGCGGGILSEPLARLGASVTGLDPGSENINTAIAHANKDDDIKDRLNYVSDTIENFSQNAPKFDALVCSEVIEHVDNVELFVQLCAHLVKDGGSLFFTTPNRTNLSYLTMILLLENVLGIIKKNTHDWNKFIKPEELSLMLESHNYTVVSYQGMVCNPLTKKWSWAQSNAMIYALHAVKDCSALLK